MQKSKNIKTQKKEDENGAALVIVMLISLLLLIACSGVLLQASMHAANVTDINAEEQAYNAAESGLQTTLNVLRGNTVPSPLLDDTKPASHPNNKMTFAKAVKLDNSNHPSDISSVTRLSRWVNYDYTPTGGSTPERVTIGSGSYTPLTGNAYSLEIIDPDNPNKLISLSITASIDGGGSSKTFGSFFSSATIAYNSRTQADVGVSISEIGIDLGSFTVSTKGVGAFVPDDVNFELKVEMTAPFKATKIIRGKIKQGYIGKSNIYNTKIIFDSGVNVLMGSILRIPKVLELNPPDTNSGKTDINVTITITEPIRLIIRSTGYGPRGSKKVLEAVVRRDVFNGGLIPATLTMVGNTAGALLKPGSNNNVVFSGNDASSGVVLPPVASNSKSGLTGLLGSILCGGSCGTTLVGEPANVGEELPDWLNSPGKLHTTIEELKTQAKASGRYFASGELPQNFGNNADGTGLTFVDGDVVFSGSGGGTLVTTGKLTLKDDFDFNGKIIVVGKDGVDKKGSGMGVINGNIVVAPYLQSDISAGFLSPQFDTSGGGVSNLFINASVSLGNFTPENVTVIGIAEK